MLVTIKIFYHLPEAEIAHSLLESYAIPSFLFGKELVALNYLKHTTMGEIRLQVPEEMVEESLKILGKNSG